VKYPKYTNTFTFLLLTSSSYYYYYYYYYYYRIKAWVTREKTPLPT